MARLSLVVTVEKLDEERLDESEAGQADTG